MEKRLTIRIPFAIWKRLRELQTDGKIKSIQEAVVKSLANFVNIELNNKS